MVKVNDWKSPSLIEAVRVWTAWGEESMPRRDDSFLFNHFGHQVASELIPIIKSLESDFYESDAKYTAADLSEMEAMAVADFRTKHPNAPDEIVKALAWCYTFDFR